MASERVVWRFEFVEVDGMGWVMNWPLGSRVLTAESTDAGVQLWAECNPDAPCGAKLFEIRGTGMTIGADAEYLATFTSPGGPNNGRWIWHLYHYPARPLEANHA